MYIGNHFVGNQAYIDIMHVGHYYKCKRCHVVLSSLNDDCGCREPFMQVFDVPVWSGRPS